MAIKFFDDDAPVVNVARGRTVKLHPDAVAVVERMQAKGAAKVPADFYVGKIRGKIATAARKMTDGKLRVSARKATIAGTAGYVLRLVKVEPK